MNNNKFKDNLNRLDAILSCVETPVDKNQSTVIQNINIFFSKIHLFFKRAYFSIVQGQWLDNKLAAKTVRNYVFNVDASEKNNDSSTRIYEIYKKLISLEGNATLPLGGLESSWILDPIDDELPSFHRVKKMSNSQNTHADFKTSFHIQANEFGKNNKSFEGSTLETTLGTLAAFLNERAEHGFPIYGLTNKDLNSISDAAQLAVDFTGIEGQVEQAFATKEPLLLPGGWVGAPSGHAMMYEIIPNLDESEKATFRLYNLGGGSSAHYGGIVGNKTKRLPYIDFTGVSKKTLLDKNVLSAIRELQKNLFYPGSDSKTEYDENDIYKGFLALLKVEPEAILTHADSPVESLKTTQYSGVCAWRSPMAYLATKMPKEQYKQFVCDIKLQNLIDRVSISHQEIFSKKGWWERLNDYNYDKKKISKAEWRLLQKSHQKLSRKIAKVFEQGVIGSRYAQYASYKLQKLSGKIEDMRDNVFKPKTRIIDSNKRSWRAKEVNLKSFNMTSQPLHEQLESVSSHMRSQPCSFVNESIKTASLKEYRQALQEILMSAETAMQASEEQALNSALVDWILKLNVENFIEFFREDPQIAKKVMEDLGKISKIFFETCMRLPDAYVVHPDKEYALTKMLYLQHQLALVIEPVNFKQLQFNLRSNDSFFFKAGDAVINEEFYQIVGALDATDESNESLSNEINELTNKINVLEKKIFIFNKKERAVEHEINDELSRINKDIEIIKELKADKEKLYREKSSLIYKKPCYDFSTNKNIGESSLLYFFNRGRWVIQSHIQGIFPDVVQKLTKNDPKFALLSTTEKNAYVYASDQLPEWFKSMRNTHLYLLYLTHECIGNPPMGEIDCTLDLRVVIGQANDEKCASVFFSVKGLTGDLIKQYPEIEKIREEPLIRYAGLFHPFQCQKLDKLVKHCAENEKMSEKEILASHVRNYSIGVSDESFKEIKHVLLNKSLRIAKAFAYFSKSPAKFADPDYQTLFQIFMFESNCLLNELKIPGFSDQFAEFMQVQLERYMKEGNIQTSVFLLRMCRLFEGYAPEKMEFQGSINKLRQLLNRVGLDPEDKSVIYGELVAAVSKKQELDSKDHFDLLVGSAYLKENPIPGKWSCPQTNKDVNEAFFIHAKSIENALIDSSGRPNAKLLNSIKRELKGGKERSWEVICEEGQFPFFTSEKKPFLAYYPLSGSLLVQNTKVNLPTGVRQHPHFRQLFSNVSQGTIKGANLYQFKDLSGHKTLIKKMPNVLIIEQERDGKWYRFVSRDAFLEENNGDLQSVFSSRHLNENFNHWQELENPSIIQIVDCASNEIYAQAHLKEDQNYGDYYDKYGNLEPNPQEVVSVIKCTGNLHLGKPQTFLTHFEDSSFIQEWYEEGTCSTRLRQVELPRFNLSFTYDTENSCLASDQFKEGGFFLSPEQYIPALAAYRQYMVLENAKGEKKVLIPNHWLEKLANSQDRESLEAKHVIGKNLASENTFKQSYSLYNVNSNGELVSGKKKDNLFLSYVYTVVQEYGSAAKLLRKYAVKLSAYNKEEELLLSKIIDLGEIVGDSSGNGIAARTFATYLLIKNKIDHTLIVAKELKNSVVPLLNDYLSHYQNITELKLTPDEEVFLIKFALNDTFDAKLFIRLEEIDPSYAKQYVPPKEMINETYLRDEQAMTFKIFFSEDSCPGIKDDFNEKQIFDFSKILITRISGYVKSNFFDLYEIARKGSDEDRKRLKKGLLFFRHQGGAQWGALLQCVLQNSVKFPAPNIRLEKSYSTRKEFEERGTWWKNVLAVADEVGAGKLDELFKRLKKTPKIANLTSEDFRLDFEYDLPDAIKVNYVAPTLTTFNSLCNEKECFRVKPFSQKSKNSLKSWLNLETKSPAIADPLYKKTIDGFLAEVTDEKVNLPAAKYELNLKVPQENGLGEIEEMLSSGKIEAERKLLKLKATILQIANTLPTNAIENVLTKLRQQGASDKVITLEDLLVYFGRSDTVSLQQRNPWLDDQEITKLFSKIAKYLLISTKEQQRNRASEQLNIVKGCLKDERCSDNELQEQVQELAERLLATRQFKAEKKPAYLVFEYFANILLRESQVTKLKQLLKDGDLNPVMEMIMGSGKSKVLLPLIGLLRADGVVLSKVLVAKPFFESVSSDTQQILGDFSQSLRSLHFDRNTVFSIYSLKMIRDDLKAIQKNKECLIMTNSSVQCFMLKFIEKCKEFLSKGEFPEELVLMREILGLLGTSGNPLVDEADTIYNVLHELSFSLGDKLSVNSRDVQVISEIYSILYSDPNIKAAARIDFDPDADIESPVLTEELYDNGDIKTLLAERFIENLKTIVFDSHELTEETQKFFGKLGLKPFVEQRKAIIHYLCRDPEHMKKAQLLYDQQSHELQNILALAAEEISGFLPHTLTRKCNEKYGLDTKDQSSIAIPYAAANTPNFGSQFAKSYITMNYTFQYYLKNGVTTEIVKKEIERLQSKAMKELKENPSMLPDDTEAWKTFRKMCGTLDFPLFNLREGQINKIVEGINATPSQKSHFVSNIILPQLELFSHKSSCNPHNLAALYAKLLGFTGTLWNSKSMHTKLQAQPERGMDMRTIKVLWEHSRDEVYTVEEGSPEFLLAQLDEQAISFDMLSDAGGYFKEGGNTAIARQMAIANGKPVVFYNERNEQVETNGKTEQLLSESKTRIADRDTFLDQSHTTGADVKQKANAVGIVTIGGNMLLRDLLQAAWRLRGLEKGQRIKFVVSKEVESIIRQRLKSKNESENEKLEVPLNFIDILRFVIINQVKQQGRDNFKAFRQELASVVQSLLFDLLLNKKSNVEEMAQAYSVLEGEWIKEACKEPRDLHGIIGHEEDSHLVVEQEKLKLINRLNEIFDLLPFLESRGLTKEKTLERVDEICKAHIDSLLAKVTVPLRDTDSDQTVERMQETQQQTQTELEVQEHKETGKTVLGRVDYRVSENPVELTPTVFLRNNSWEACSLLMSDICQFDSALENFNDAFEGIRVSINALEWPSKEPQVSDLKLLGNHRILFEFVKVVNEGRDLIILSQEDANMEKNEKDFSLSLYNLTTGFNDKRQPVSPELFEKIVKVKFLSGESSYTKAELQFLEKWFNEQGKERMLDLFQTKILAGHPDKAADYKNGNLRDLLQQ